MELRRELLALKLDVLAHPENALDWGVMTREGALLADYEAEAIAGEQRDIEATRESYRAEEAAAR